MYDTIAIMSPELDNEVLHLLNQKSKTNIQIDNSTGTHYKSLPYGLVENEYGIPISFKLYRTTTGETQVRLEASVHKLLVGHNNYGAPKDFYSSAAYLVGEFERLMGINFPPVMDWQVQRVDVSEFYRIKSQSKCDAWFRAFRKAEFPRREINRYGNHSIWIKGQTTVVKFYNKGLEFRQSKSEFKRLKKLMEKEDFVRLLIMSDRIIKVEVEIKRDKFASDFVGDFTVRAISNEYLEKVHDYEVNKILKETHCDFNLVRKSDDVFKRLKYCYKPKLTGKLMEFWIDLSFNGEQKVKKSIPRSTFYRYLKQLKDAGVDWKANNLSSPSASLIPPDFSPVRGNKYHMDVTLDEVEKKLLPYSIEENVGEAY